MSTAAQQTREKRQRTRGDLYAQRPAHEPFNSPWPKYGWMVQHAMTEKDDIILRAMASLKPTDLKGGIYGQGRVLRNTSIARIARATARFTFDSEPLARRTVAYRLQIQQKKGITRRYEADPKPKNSPFGTSWYMPPFDKVLADWAADPNVGTVGKKRAFAVRGKGRDLCTPQVLIDWKFDGVQAEASPAAHVPTEAWMLAAAATQTAPAAPPPEPAPPDLAPIMDALIDVSGRGTLEDAGWIWKEVLRNANKRPAPAPEDVAGIIRTMGANWRKIGQQAPLDHGLIKRKIGGHLETWHREQSQKRAAEAKAAQWDRDQRINTAVDFIRQLARGDLPPPDAEFMAEWLRALDSEERAEADRLLEKLNARSA